MWHHMFVEQIPVAEKLLRTVLVYALIAVLIRAMGKRGLAGLNTLDIAVVFLLSNVVQNAIIGEDVSVTGGAIGAATLVAVNALLNRMAVNSRLFARIFDGRATKVIADGEVVPKALKRVGLRKAELKHAVRMQNGNDLAEVKSGVLEPSGQLIVTLRKDDQSATKGDVDDLKAQLTEIRRLLAATR